MVEKTADDRRTASNLVDCLLGDVMVIVGEMAADKKRDLENRFHVTMRHHRRLIERASKKHKRSIMARNKESNAD